MLRHRSDLLHGGKIHQFISMSEAVSRLSGFMSSNPEPGASTVNCEWRLRSCEATFAVHAPTGEKRQNPANPAVRSVPGRIGGSARAEAIRRASSLGNVLSRCRGARFGSSAPDWPLVRRTRRGDITSRDRNCPSPVCPTGEGRGGRDRELAGAPCYFAVASARFSASAGGDGRTAAPTARPSRDPGSRNGSGRFSSRARTSAAARAGSTSCAEIGYAPGENQDLGRSASEQI